jgi:FdhE protein
VGLLGKLLGGARPLPPDLAEAMTELAKLRESRAALHELADMLATALPLLFAQPATESPPQLTADEAAAKLATGLPLLRDTALDLGETAFRKRWQSLCAAVQSHRPGEAVSKLAKALGPGLLDPKQMFAEVCAGQLDAIRQRATGLELDVRLTMTLVRLALLPVLAKINTAWLAARRGTDWHHGYCPTCGGGPLLGEFRGLEQTRWLRCGLCASEWEFPRLECPFCGSGDHQLLGYFHAEGEENHYRATTCEACRGYVKMVTTLAALSAPQLLVADLATLHLDLAAGDRGYNVN